MSVFSKIRKYITNPRSFICALLSKGYFNWLGDKPYLKLAYRAWAGKKLHLKNPVTFTEKLQWIKLYDRRPEYTRMVDKYEAKAYVAERIGEEYIIPTLGVWDSFDEIDFDALPDRFVLKCTHDSGGLVICKNKSKLDLAAAKAKLEACLKRNFFYLGREWPYKNIKPRIIAEQFIEDTHSDELHDYKFYCFNGKCGIMLVISDRESDEPMKVDFFDMDQNVVDVKFEQQPTSKTPPALPKNFDKMRELAEVLAKDIPHVRIDFYEVNGKILFGEITFFSSSGFNPFYPHEWEERIGGWITLPEKTIN